LTAGAGPVARRHQPTISNFPLTTNPAMGDIARVFHVDVPTLIAQCVILFVVFAVLNKFAFGPITQLLLERRRRIEEAEANFERSKEKLATAASEADQVIADANTHAARLIKEAQDAAASTAEKKRQEAIAEAATIIAKGREAATIERDQVFATLKRDFSRLVIDTTGKVTGKVLNQDDHARINQEAVTQISR